LFFHLLFYPCNALELCDLFPDRVLAQEPKKSISRKARRSKMTRVKKKSGLTPEPLVGAKTRKRSDWLNGPCHANIQIGLNRSDP
jgi:hypothetical protein